MARKRLRLFDYLHLLERLRDGQSARDMERSGIASRNKIASVRKLVEPLGWLNPTNPIPSAEQIQALLVKDHVMPVRPSLTEPHREKVEKLAESGRTPKQIWRVLRRENDFQGSVGSVKRFLKRLGKTQPKAFVALHFEPGEAAQVDFGSGPMIPHPETGKLTRTHIFVMTLCDSRHMYAEIVWDQKVKTWLRCHRNALEFFEGVPSRIILDNLKAAILRHCHYDPEVQKAYGEFARGYRFQIDPCKPRTPRHKGRVERGVAYVKSAFVPDRTFRNIADANQQLTEWILGEAGNRIHGTTHEVPLRAFAEREKQALQSLPEERPELVTWSVAKLHPNCHINFEKSYYSAPHRLVGQTLHVRATDTMVELYQDGEVVALHPIATRPGQFRTNPDHYPSDKVAYTQKTPQWCVRESAETGPSCRLFVAKLFADGVTRRLGSAQGTLRLREKYGARRLEAACARALDHDLICYKSVKDILEKGLDQCPESPDSSGQIHFHFPEKPRFARNIGEMMSENRIGASR